MGGRLCFPSHALHEEMRRAGGVELGPVLFLMSALVLSALWLWYPSESVSSQADTIVSLGQT